MSFPCDIGGDWEDSQSICPRTGLSQEAFPGQILCLHGPESPSSLPDCHIGVSPPGIKIGHLRDSTDGSALGVGEEVPALPSVPATSTRPLTTTLLLSMSMVWPLARPVLLQL